MDRHAGRLADGEEAGDDGVRIAIADGDDLAVEVRRDAAHVVVHGRGHRNRLARQVDAGEGLRRLGNARQALVQDLRVDMVEVKEDVVLVLADAAAFADFHRHRAGHDVAAGEILRVRCVALHEALALAIGQVAALAARALGDEHAGAVDAGRVELDELHVLQRQAGAEHHGIAVAGAGVGGGGGEIGAPIAAGGKHHGLCAEAMDRTIIHAQCDDAAALAVFHNQVERKIFDEEVGVIFQALLVERVQHRMAGAVGGGASALGGRALAHVLGHSAERALVDLAVGACG